MDESSPAIESSIVAPRPRSVQNPGSTIDESIDFVKSLHKLNGSPAALFTIDNVTGILKSGSFPRDFSAAVQYGFLERLKDGYKITEFGHRARNPLAGELPEIKRQAFLSTSFYAPLIERFANNVVPEELPIILYRSHGVAEKASKGVAQIFLENARLAGIMDADNILRISPSNIPPQTITTADQVPLIQTPPIVIGEQGAIIPPAPLLPLAQMNGAETERVKLTESKFLAITYPQDMKKKDYEILAKWIEMKMLTIE